MNPYEFLKAVYDDDMSFADFTYCLDSVISNLVNDDLKSYTDLMNAEIGKVNERVTKDAAIKYPGSGILTGGMTDARQNHALSAEFQAFAHMLQDTIAASVTGPAVQKLCLYLLNSGTMHQLYVNKLNLTVADKVFPPGMAPPGVEAMGAIGVAQMQRDKGRLEKQI